MEPEGHVTRPAKESQESQKLQSQDITTATTAATYQSNKITLAQGGKTISIGVKNIRLSSLLCGYLMLLSLHIAFL